MDVRLAMYQKEIEKIEDDMLPFGYYDDGLDEVPLEVEEEEWTGNANDKWLILNKKEFKNPININNFSDISRYGIF